MILRENKQSPRSTGLIPKSSLRAIEPKFITRGNKHEEKQPVLLIKQVSLLIACSATPMGSPPGAVLEMLRTTLNSLLLRQGSTRGMKNALFH